MGWLNIPGVQWGARTLAEQMMGLQSALVACPGKSVLDLGCAEGLIALEFAKAGASSVLGVDSNIGFIQVARDELRKAGPLPVEFHVFDVSRLAPFEHEIVLALAILHKLEDPAAGIRLCAEIARELIVVRLPRGSTGLIAGKFSHVVADVPDILENAGFALERMVRGPRGEFVQYYRRSKSELVTP